MKVYIKGYYGYKNFGDELLFFGLINYLSKYFDISEYVLEVGDKQRMDSRIAKNKKYLSIDHTKIRCVPIQQHRYKIITHIKTFLGLSPYRLYLKVFGGGELFDASKFFPHNGWNLLILYCSSIFKKNFILAGGIGQTTKWTDRFLQKIVLTRAQKVICRDDISYHRAKKHAGKKAIAYHDFSFDVMQQREKTPQQTTQEILINTAYTPQVAEKLKKYPTHQYVFFPCEYTQDKKFLNSLQQHIADIHIYDWTQHSLETTVQKFAYAKYGIGERLHFCLPLQYFAIPYHCINMQDKHKKLLTNAEK